MDYSIELTLSPDLDLQPVATRIFSELAEVREGPGEEMERLASAVEPVLAALLAALGRRPGRPSLVLKIESAEVRVDIVVEAGEGGRGLLGESADDVLAGLAAVFDDVQAPAAAEGPFRLALTRHIPC